MSNVATGNRFGVSRRTVVAESPFGRKSAVRLRSQNHVFEAEEFAE